MAALIAHKESGQSLISFEAGETRERDAIVDVDCEIWIPAARPDVIDEANADRLRARLVVEGANIPVTEGAGRRLAARGVLAVPDFIANAGGVICGAVEYAGGSQAAALATIEEKVRRNTAEVLENAKTRGVAPREAAVDLALQRVRRAMTYRRWS